MHVHPTNDVICKLCSFVYGYLSGSVPVCTYYLHSMHQPMATVRCNIDFVQAAHICKYWHACGYSGNAYKLNGPIPCLFHAASGMRAMVVVTQLDMDHRCRQWVH